MKEVIKISFAQREFTQFLNVVLDLRSDLSTIYM